MNILDRTGDTAHNCVLLVFYTLNCLRNILNILGLFRIFWEYFKYSKNILNILELFRIFWESFKYSRNILNIIGLFSIFWEYFENSENILSILDRTGDTAHNCVLLVFYALK